jgi:hypothetical protein
MHTNEIVFAFAVMPVYLGVTLALSRRAVVRRAGVPAVFVLNWAIAALVLGTYTAVSGLAGGNWFGVSIFSGVLAATLATALATRFTRARN